MRKRLLIGLALLSMLAAAAAGYYFWDVLVVAVLVALAWAKKLATLNGLLLLLKKAPLFLLGGIKKIALKVLGGLLVLSARARIRPVRKLLVLLKLRVRRMLRRLRFHWATLSPLEKAATLVALVPLTLLVLGALLYLLLIPRPLKLLAARKLRESTCATMIDKVVPANTRALAQELHGKAEVLVTGELEVKRTPAPDSSCSGIPTPDISQHRRPPTC